MEKHIVHRMAKRCRRYSFKTRKSRWYTCDEGAGSTKTFDCSVFFWFAEGSPYAMKFQETSQRILETNLWHWPILTRKDGCIVNIKKPKTTFDKVNLEQLLTVLSFDFSISIIGFLSELFLLKIRKIKQIKIYNFNIF